jgi:hypothetical protein
MARSRSIQARGAGNRCSVTTLELPVIAEPVLRIGFLQSAKASGEPRLHTWSSRAGSLISSLAADGAVLRAALSFNHPLTQDFCIKPHPPPETFPSSSSVSSMSRFLLVLIRESLEVLLVLIRESLEGFRRFGFWVFLRITLLRFMRVLIANPCRRSPPRSIRYSFARATSPATIDR